MTATPNTFPRLLAENVRTRGDEPAYREKDLGIWNTWTWRAAATEIRAIACGLAEHGFKRGDRLAIVGDNRPEFYWSIVAAQCLGGIPVPLYQDSVADEMRYVLDHAETRFARTRSSGAARLGSKNPSCRGGRRRSSSPDPRAHGRVCKSDWTPARSRPPRPRADVAS